MVASPSAIWDGIRTLTSHTRGMLDQQNPVIKDRISNVIMNCRSLFRVTYDPDKMEYRSSLPVEGQMACSNILTSVIDRQIIGNFSNLKIDQYKGCFMFFRAVTDEMPVSLRAFRVGILAHYNAWLSPIYYPQLVSSTTAETVHPILKEIRDRGLVDYYGPSYDFYGQGKVPYLNPLTLGEFAAYRLIMGHRTIQDLIHLDTLAMLQRALVIHGSILPLAHGDEILTHLIHNLATFATEADLEKFCAEAARDSAARLDLFS